MHQMGLCGALEMDLCERVCLLERIWHSQQPDVCRAIPLHNYLRTSGTYKHSEWAPAIVFFSPVLSLHHCPRSQVCFFLPLCVALSCLILYKQSCFQFPLPLFPPPSSPHLTTYAYIYFSIPSCTAPMPEHMHFSVSLHVLPPLHLHIHIQFCCFSLSQLVTTLSPPCHHLLLSLLLTLVKISSLPNAPTAEEPICYSNKVSPGARMESLLHKSSCKLLCTVWTVFHKHVIHYLLLS